MDRGAARSKKRAAKAAAAALAASTSKLDLLLGKKPKGDRSERSERGDRPKARDGDRIDRKDREGERSDGKEGRKERKPRPEKKPRVDPNDPNRFKPKAVRTAKALIYSQEAFDIPPPPERLEGVTRIDLEGSGCTDVSWLPGSTTWLSLKGCEVKEGWEAVGKLENLAVLNISGCGLKELPEELKDLGSLKALVAVGNEWTGLGGAVAGWKLLNSLIISHSPNLTSLPDDLATLPHLAKLTFSHCPRLTASGLPDLSPLPLLRDVRANNLPLLTSLPSHLSTWGTGSLSLVGKKDVPGDGLEVLDLGNCSLPLSSIRQFLAPLKPGSRANFPHLRSLTLSANPLCLEAENYAQQLQDSPQLPKIQIIDTKRLVERKRKGEVPESKRERKARERALAKQKPTGANVDTVGKMRTWGKAEGDGDGEGTEPETDAGSRKGAKGEERRKEKRRKGDDEDEDEETRRIRERMERAQADMEMDVDSDVEREPAVSGPSAAVAEGVDGGDGEEGGKKKRKRKRTRKGADVEPEPEPEPERPTKKLRDTEASSKPRAESKSKPESKSKSEAKTELKGKPDLKGKADAKGKHKKAKGPDQATVAAIVADPTVAKPSKPSRSETAVVGVVDVKKDKKKDEGGVDLAAVLKTDSGSGLGVGGW